MALVLLPGFMTDADLWRDVAPLWAGLGPVSFGDVTQDDSIAGMARRVLAEAPARFLLLGFSMGGYVAREVVRQAPDRVIGLVQVATSARADSAVQAERKRAILQRPPGAAFRGLSRTALIRGLHPDHAADEQLIDRLRQMGDRLGEAVFLRQSALVRDQDDTALAAIACPTLVLAAAQDQLRSIAEAEELRAGIPGATLHIIENCGHMVPMEAPETLARLVLDFVGKIQTET